MRALDAFVDEVHRAIEELAVVRPAERGLGQDRAPRLAREHDLVLGLRVDVEDRRPGERAGRRLAQPAGLRMRLYERGVLLAGRLSSKEELCIDFWL